MSDKKTTSNGIGIGMILFLIFMTLKLTGHITWSWLWVFSPLWIPISVGVIIAGTALLIAFIAYKNKQ
jgi:ABC-type antimicrobial peptide transport system permease subunit